jgi:hypothetical protein
MSWVENTLRSIDREVALKQKEEAEKSSATPCNESPITAGTPVSEDAIQPSELLEGVSTNPALSQLLKGAVIQQKEENLTADELVAQAVQDPAQAVKLLQVAQQEGSRHPTRLAELPSIVTDIREQASMLKTAAQIQKRNEEGNTEITGKTFIAALNKAGRNAAPPLAATLLHPKFWNLSQSAPSHERPHGRYMEPGFHPFWPKKQDPGGHEGESWLYSASGTAQFVLYVGDMMTPFWSSFRAS